MRQKTFRFSVTTLAGSTLKNIHAIMESHHVESGYRKKFFLSKAIAGTLEILTRAEWMVWHTRIQNHRLTTPPIFIIGFWRSGTTLLHNLLCKDPEAAYTTTFQTVFPHITLTQSWWLKPLINLFLPAQRPFDNASMDMNFPQEEDFGMMNIQPASIYKFLLFPTEFDRIIDQELFTGNLPPEKLSRWKEAYLGMIAKAIFNNHGKRYIGKNPCHLTRMGLLKEMFPDAKFIFIHRHPYKVIESLYQFIFSVFPGVQLQDVPASFSREKVVMLYTRMINAYLQDREQIPSSDLIELRLDNFLKDIPGNLEMIYRKFRLGEFSKISSIMEKYLAENPCPIHKSHSPTPETIRLVDMHASGIMQKLGYTSLTGIRHPEPGTLKPETQNVPCPEK